MMHKALSQSVSQTPSIFQPVSIGFRFLDAAIFLGALVSVLTLQSWRFMDLRFAGGLVDFLLPWLWLASLLMLQGLRFFPPRDMPSESLERLNRMLLWPSILVALVLLLNTITFYHLKVALHGRMPWYMPMSLPICLALLLWLIGRPDRIAGLTMARNAVGTTPWRTVHYGRYDVMFSVFFFLLLLWIFHGLFLADPPPPGTKADLAIVLGAGTGPGDTCGYTLRQRVLEGVRLFKEHRVQRLLLTGRAPRGQTNTYENEPLAMVKLALAQGVPAGDIILDFHGDNTRYSAYDASALIRAKHWHKIIAVSSDYHLPRIALAFRQLGIHVWTVPAQRGLWHQSNPWAMLRELVGYPVYWLDQNYHHPRVVPLVSR